MACWWVFQNSTYREESEGSFLWAPKVDAGGHTPHHWKTMTKLKEGDIVFSCVKQKIVAISTVVTSAYSYDKPFNDINLDRTWETEGYKADLIFTELETPIEIRPISNKLLSMMPTQYAPLNRNGRGNQGYLFHISDEIGQYLISISEKNDDLNLEEKEIADIQSCTTIINTQKESIIQSRVGQGQFRSDLLDYWNEKCAVTGLQLPKILKASHIKPWKFSNNQERLDPNNGLLLSPNYDDAFDKGYISFDQNGLIVFSNLLTEQNKVALGFNSNDRIQKSLNNWQKTYLEYHNNERLLKE